MLHLVTCNVCKQQRTALNMKILVSNRTNKTLLDENMIDVTSQHIARQTVNSQNFHLINNGNLQIPFKPYKVAVNGPYTHFGLHKAEGL